MPQLDTLHLRDDASQLDATFVPGAGMLCCSLRHRGHELLAQNAGVDAYAASGKTMGIPLLYPWANRLAGYDYTAAARKVRVPRDESLVRTDGNGLPIHGVIGGRQAWRLEDGTGRQDGAGGQGGAGPDAASLAARLSWSEEQPALFEVFPFRHDLRYEARLRDGRLEIAVTVHASGDDAVPLAFGFHPYLSPPGVPREDWHVELPPMRALALDARQIPTGPERELPAESFELDARQFDDGFDSVADGARFVVADASRRIELAFARGYPCAQVFAPAAGQFICFEPMTAPANALRSGDGLRVVQPGERFTAAFSVAVVDRGAPD